MKKTFRKIQMNHQDRSKYFGYQYIGVEILQIKFNQLINIYSIRDQHPDYYFLKPIPFPSLNKDPKRKK